jgi:hypothetical protein
MKPGKVAVATLFNGRFECAEFNFALAAAFAYDEQQKHRLFDHPARWIGVGNADDLARGRGPDRPGVALPRRQALRRTGPE